MSTDTQSNLQQGRTVRTAGEALTDLEGRVLALVNSSGSPVVKLPDAVTDFVSYVLADGGASGDDVEVIPLAHGQLIRARLQGTCVSGDKLVLATINGTDDGKVIKLPTSAGTYRLVGLAEESGVDEQLVMLRVQTESIVVSP